MFNVPEDLKENPLYLQPRFSLKPETQTLNMARAQGFEP